jgi:hypothetical protein
MPIDVLAPDRIALSQKERDVGRPAGAGIALLRSPILQAAGVTNPGHRTFPMSPKCGHFSCCPKADNFSA